MRLLPVCLAVLACAALVEAKEPKVVWQKLSPAGSKVEIEFPGKAEEKVTKYGRNFVLPALGDKAVYILSYGEFERDLDLADKATVKTALDNAREKAALSLKGELLTEKNITLGKFPGRAIDLSVPGALVYRSRIYLTPKRVYQVTVLGPKDFVESGTATRFLGSLKWGK